MQTHKVPKREKHTNTKVEMARLASRTTNNARITNANLPFSNCVVCPRAGWRRRHGRHGWQRGHGCGREAPVAARYRTIRRLRLARRAFEVASMFVHRPDPASQAGSSGAKRATVRRITSRVRSGSWSEAGQACTVAVPVDMEVGIAGTTIWRRLLSLTRLCHRARSISFCSVRWCGAAKGFGQSLFR